MCCVIPENNPSPPQKGWEIPIGRAQREREREREKKCMKENWNFHRGGGVIEQTPYMGRATHFILVEDPQARGGAYWLSSFLRTLPGVLGTSILFS